MDMNIITQVIVGLFTIIGAVLSVMLVLAKKLNNAPQSNGQKKLDNGMQRQLDNADDSAKSLSSQFCEQVKECNVRWMGEAEFRGEIKAYMIEIRDRLGKIERQ